MTGRDRILAALTGAPLDRLPVWLMRQAGRYLPEYRKIRSEVSFLELCRSPELCTEVALQPLRRYPLDATIVFSDILVVPDAMGIGLRFTPGDGPTFDRPVRNEADVRALVANPTEHLTWVYDAVRQLRAAAPEHALFGFAGSPWTLFAYAVEGEANREFPHALAAMDEPWAVAFLDLLTEAVAEHLRHQINAGADVVQIFDTWGGLLSRADWERIVAPRIRRIVARLDAPTVLFVRADDGRGEGLCTALSVPPGTSLARFAGPTQGNVAPEVLVEGDVEAAVATAFAELGARRNHIFNLGHGLVPQTPPERVARFVKAVQELPC